MGCAAAVVLICAGLTNQPSVRAQTEAAGAAQFDVASLKPVQPSPPYPVDLGNSLHGKVTLTNVTLTECLRFAFKINNDSQIAGPDWIKSRDVLFAIVGQAPPETPKDKLRLMTLKLLTDRFKLELHHEQRELAYFALVIDKKGSKLPEAKEGGDDSGSEMRQGRIAVHRVSIAMLILMLGRFTSGPIVDLTGLTGWYDVKLEWTPLKQSDQADTLAGPTLFDAVQEQLGLKMEMRKGPMDVTVVDHAEKTPLPN